MSLLSTQSLDRLCSVSVSAALFLLGIFYLILAPAYHTADRRSLYILTTLILLTAALHIEPGLPAGESQRCSYRRSRTLGDAYRRIAPCTHHHAYSGTTA